MKVLMLAPWKAAIVQRLVTALRKEGVEVILASHHAKSEAGVEDLGDITTIFSYFQKRTVNQLIDKYQPDVIHAHGATHYGMMASMQDKVPYILALWGSEIMLSPVQGSWIKRFFYSALVKRTVQKAELCHSSSEHVCKQASILSGCETDKFRTFFWGVVPNEILLPPQAKLIKKWEALHPILQGRHFILSGRGVRDIYQPKEVANIIRKYAGKLLEKGFVFVVLRGYSSDSDVECFLKELRGLEDFFVFINEELDDKSLGYFYHKSVVHFSIPYSDSLGGGVVEPAMCGSLPVLSDLPGNRWFLEKCEGMIYDSSFCLYDILKKISQESANERTRVTVNLLGQDMVIREMLDMYQSLTGGR